MCVKDDFLFQNFLVITVSIFNLWCRGNEKDEENVDQIADEDTEVKLERDRVAEYFTNRFILFLIHMLNREIFYTFVPTLPTCDSLTEGGKISTRPAKFPRNKLAHFHIKT